MQNKITTVRRMPALFALLFLYMAGIVFTNLTSQRNIEPLNGFPKAFAQIFFTSECKKDGVVVSCQSWHNSSTLVRASAGAPTTPPVVLPSSIVVNRESH